MKIPLAGEWLHATFISYLHFRIFHLPLALLCRWPINIYYYYILSLLDGRRFSSSSFSTQVGRFLPSFYEMNARGGDWGIFFSR